MRLIATAIAAVCCALNLALVPADPEIMRTEPSFDPCFVFAPDAVEDPDKACDAGIPDYKG